MTKLKKVNRNSEAYIYELVSQNVKKYRMMRGLTQSELAYLIPYSYSTVISIEGNYRNNFSLAVIGSIAKALNIRMYLLFMDENETKQLLEKKSKKQASK